MDKDLTKKTANGLSHGLINSIANSVDISLEKKIKSTKKEEYQKVKKYDSEIISARYLNYLGEDDRLEMSYMKYAGDPITKWRFLNNEVYKVPRGLIKQVNEAHKMGKKRIGLLDKDSNPIEQEQNNEKTHEFVGII